MKPESGRTIQKAMAGGKKHEERTVVVVGAGLVGAITAIFLGRRGYKVIVHTSI